MRESDIRCINSRMQGKIVNMEMVVMMGRRWWLQVMCRSKKLVVPGRKVSVGKKLKIW